MKFTKRLTAFLLCAACVCALIAVPPAEAAGTVSTFPDITDPQMGRAVEALRTMGVIDGGGDGTYDPDGSLTRAAFCKMAILVMGKGDEADAQANRTIFNDVPGSHWARGYVNLAALTTVGGGEDDKDAPRLMMGLGNGSFAPDRVISYGEAVTILLRLLGYAKEAELNWPSGAVSTAASLGLTQGFAPPRAGAAVTRGQAALLFCNMLTVPISGDKETSYLKSLGYTEETGALLLASNAKTESGQSGAVKVFGKDGPKDAVLPAVRTPASFLEGARGTAVYDQKGRFFTFLPDADASSKTITVAKISGRILTATDGTSLTLSNNTPVWIDGEKKDFSDVMSALGQGGSSVTVCYTPSGSVESLFVHGTSMTLSGGVMVARDKVSGNPFALLTKGTTDYKIMKNGAEVTTSALTQYDVAAFDPTNKTLYVTDFRLTGVYEAASPNTSMPTSVTVLDKTLDVLDCAVDDLKGLKLGSQVTFLLSPDGKVAGAVSSSALRSNTVGWVNDSKVQLLNAPSGLSELPLPEGFETAKYADCLVTVTGGQNGTIYLSRMNGRMSSKPLDLTARTLGGAPLAENVAVFDRIANSSMKRIALTDISMESVPGSKIAYQRVNSAGKVDLLLLDNVTGDLYTYGIASLSSNDISTGETTIKYDKDGNPVQAVDENGNKLYEMDDENNFKLDENGNKIPVYESVSVTLHNDITTVTNSAKSVSVIGGTKFRDNQFIGLAASVEQMDGISRSAGSVALKSIENASPYNFNQTTGIFFLKSTQLPIAENVQCYNAQTKTWFGAGDEDATGMDNLRACLAYSSNLTVWYDRDPAQGGKVRVVVAN